MEEISKRTRDLLWAVTLLMVVVMMMMMILSKEVGKYEENYSITSFCNQGYKVI